MIRKLMWINDFDLKAKKEYIDDEKKVKIFGKKDGQNYVY